MLNKIIINYTIIFFIIISVVIVCLINLYYLTPHNYIIVNKNINDITSDLPFKVIDIKIKPNSNYKIPYEQIKNKIIIFDKEEINTIFSNLFKSQNIIYDKNTILMTNYSDLIIINKLNKEVKIKMSLYNN